MNENHNKALAIIDLAMKISENSPTDVFAWYNPHVKNIDVSIFWDGWKLGEDVCKTRYDVPLDGDIGFSHTAPDAMLGILEEIWTDILEKGAEA